MSGLSILCLDDEKLILDELSEFLEELGHGVRTTRSPSEALQILGRESFDIAIVDLRMPEMDGMEVLELIRSAHPNVEVIMITGHGDAETILQALRLGAFDYFSKPIRLLELQTALERTKRYRAVKRRLELSESRLERLRAELTEHTGIELVGSSPAIKAVLELARRAAESPDTTVLVMGPSGSGKELVARAIHQQTPDRARAPLLPVNCAAVPETLVESELFGHRKGSFTGAVDDRAGCFEAAHRGTLFLDEIGDMSSSFQAKLLRVLEERTVRRVGASEEIPVDVRVIAATNQDLPRLIQEKRFRLDLYHRLNTIEIRIPPLAERPEDIRPLFEHFVARYATRLNRRIDGWDPEVVGMLERYSFPGNVRELRNLVERAVIFSDDGQLTAKHFLLPSDELLARAAGAPATETDLDLGHTEERLIREALAKARGNKTKAAQFLGISSFALARKVKKLEGE